MAAPRESRGEASAGSRGDPLRASWRRASLACGLLPLVGGTLLFALWLVIRDERLVVPGVFATMTGAAVVGLGLVLLLFAILRKEPGRGVLGTPAILSILLLNFPAALTYALVVTHQWLVIRVVLVNESDQAVEELALSGGGVESDGHCIEAGESIELVLRPTHDGEVAWTAIQGGEPCGGILLGYVTPGLADRRAFRFSGECRLEERAVGDLR